MQQPPPSETLPSLFIHPRPLSLFRIVTIVQTAVVSQLHQVREICLILASYFSNLGPLSSSPSLLLSFDVNYEATSPLLILSISYTERAHNFYSEGKAPLLSAGGYFVYVSWLVAPFLFFWKRRRRPSTRSGEQMMSVCVLAL